MPFTVLIKPETYLLFSNSRADRDPTNLFIFLNGKSFHVRNCFTYETVNFASNSVEFSYKQI